jgi:hypothetical protein
MKYSTEVLHHFTCDNCQLWWSISAISEILLDKKGWWCPWCGHQHIPPYENVTVGKRPQDDGSEQQMDWLSIDDPSLPEDLRKKLAENS